MMKRLDLKFKFVVPVTEEGSFTGLGAVFETVDAEGDTIAPGAFSKDLALGNVRPLLWQHDAHTPIGVAYLEENSKGLAVLGAFCMGVKRAREIRSLMAQGVVTGLSVGFEPIKAVVDKRTRARRLTEIKVWEISPCLWPANDSARVTDVKSMIPAEIKQMVLDFKELEETFTVNQKIRLSQLRICELIDKF